MSQPPAPDARDLENVPKSGEKQVRNAPSEQARLVIDALKAELDLPPDDSVERDNKNPDRAP